MGAFIISMSWTFNVICYSILEQCGLAHMNPCNYALHRKNTATVLRGSRTVRYRYGIRGCAVDVHGITEI